MASSDVQMLMEMGFTQEKAERAVAVTGNQGVEPAMEWLLAHGGELEVEMPAATGNVLPAAMETTGAPAVQQPAVEQPSVEQPAIEQPAATNAVEEGDGIGSGSTTETAKSLRCDECGKLFKNQLEVEFHAAKSGHSSFSESTEEKKPLTEEEKKEQLRKVEEKLKQKRKEREEKEKVEALEKEKIRIRSGKEMVAAKKKLEEQEMQKLVEQRRREKEEEKRAKERVRAQIEADKAARKAKFSGGSVEVAPAPAVPSTPAPAALPTQSKDYANTRIQIRLTNGQALTQTFFPKEQLSAVRLYVEMNRTDGDGPFTLMTNFPKKVFQEEDYEKPLDVLGLVPSAVVIVTRATH